MEGTQMPKLQSGGIWIILGMIGFVIGGILSVTMVGAICGLPFIIGSIPLIIYGTIKNHKWKMQKLSDSIKEGIKEGMDKDNKS